GDFEGVHATGTDGGRVDERQSPGGAVHRAVEAEIIKSRGDAPPADGNDELGVEGRPVIIPHAPNLALSELVEGRRVLVLLLPLRPAIVNHYLARRRVRPLVPIEQPRRSALVGPAAF